LGNRNRRDLIPESAVSHRGRRPSLAFEREIVLVLTRHAVLLSNVLCGHAHVAGADRAVERQEQSVLDLEVAKSLTPAALAVQERDVAHLFNASGDNHVGIPDADRLGR